MALHEDGFGADIPERPSENGKWLLFHSTSYSGGDAKPCPLPTDAQPGLSRKALESFRAETLTSSKASFHFKCLVLLRYWPGGAERDLSTNCFGGHTRA